MKVSRHSTPWGRNALTDEDRALIAETPGDLEALFSRHYRTRVFACQLMRGSFGVGFDEGPTPRDAFLRAVAKVAA